MMYKDFRNKTTALLRITEKQYYQEQIIANAFNNYFANVGATLASKIPDQGVDFSVYMPPANECSLF